MRAMPEIYVRDIPDAKGVRNANRQYIPALSLSKHTIVASVMNTIRSTPIPPTSRRTIRTAIHIMSIIFIDATGMILREYGLCCKYVDCQDIAVSL